jgi:hypothetical protein
MSAWQEYKKKLGTTRPWDVFDPRVENIAEEDAIKRYETCLGCPRLLQSTKQCRECGCFMALKVKIKEATCPIGKW